MSRPTAGVIGENVTSSQCQPTKPVTSNASAARFQTKRSAQRSASGSASGFFEARNAETIARTARPPHAIAVTTPFQPTRRYLVRGEKSFVEAKREEHEGGKARSSDGFRSRVFIV